MNPTNIFSKYYIDSNIHVGVATASLTVISLLEIGTIAIYEYSFFVFFATVLSYNFIRVFDNVNFTFKSFKQRVVEQEISKVICCILFIIGLLYFSWKIGFWHLLLLLPTVFITFWYAVPLRIFTKHPTSLRNHPKLKLFSIAIVCAIVTVLFPLQNELSNSQTWLVFLQRLLVVTVLILPFDIRDMHKDENHLQTLPQQIGLLKTKKIGVLLLVIFFILTFFKTPITTPILLSELFVYILTMLFLIRVSNRQSEYYASFWVESIPIMWLFSLLIFQRVL